MSTLIGDEDAVMVLRQNSGAVIDHLHGQYPRLPGRDDLDVRSAIPKCIRDEVPENLTNPDRVGSDVTGSRVYHDGGLPRVGESREHTLDLSLEADRHATYRDVSDIRSCSHEKIVNEIRHVATLLNQHGCELTEFVIAEVHPAFTKFVGHTRDHGQRGSELMRHRCDEGVLGLEKILEPGLCR